MAKSNTDLKSIQRKLVAAVAMVLVASIMVVSSSYAWFTLSTAPEVTGITTSVGANGNLEMALRTEKGAVIQTSTTAANFPEANNFWGNLVKLDDESYHLNSIALRPARLNAAFDDVNSVQREVQKTKDGVLVWLVDGNEVAADTQPAGGTAVEVTDSEGNVVQKTKDGVLVWSDGTAEYAADTKAADAHTAVMTTEWSIEKYVISNGGYLKTPVYGADGRISALDPNTVNGVYMKNDGAFAYDSTGNIMGVRAVGTTSQISPAELAMRQAKQAVSAAISTSKSSATISLRDDSVKLANIIVMNQLDANTTYGTTEKTDIQNAINNLNDVAEDLHEALKYAVVAVGVSQSKSFGIADVTFSSSDITVTGVELDWSTLSAEKARLLNAYATYTTIKTDLTNAQTELDKLSGKDSDITFTEISAPLTTLLSTADFNIVDPSNGVAYTVGQFKDLGMVSMATIMLSTPTIRIVNGIYYDIALFSGNYSATTSMVINGDFGGYTFNNQKVTVVMATNATEPATGYYLADVQNWMSGLTVGEGGEAATLITDIYGYAIDLAFRTNAAGSSLLLQTDAANRVDDSTVTQGAGSYMEFTSGHADFSMVQVANLMQSIRVVFVDDNGSIYGVAALEIGVEPVMNGSEKALAAEMDAALYDIMDAEGYAYKLTSGEVTADGKIKAPLYMYNFTVDSNGVLQLNGKKSDSVITSLVQNTQVGVSALVYLDGDEVENGDVAINGNSMTGTMNLQFASDAELNPMDYTFTEKQLTNPTVSFDSATKKLNITEVENAEKYQVLVNGAKVHEVTAAGEYDLTSVLAAFTTAGDYKITVVATATGYTDSTPSDEIVYTVS